MSKYKCIIFDCDGVLVDSEPLSNQVMVDIANELGANINLDYALRNFKGNSFNNCAEQISNLIGKEVPRDLEDIYRQRSFEKFRNEIKPIEGIKAVLDVLNVPFCVASSGPESKIKLNLELTGLLEYFIDNIFSCYTIGKWKPDPSIFIWAATTMGYSPNECLIIEDSIIGVNAALKGGFDVFGYTAHDYNDELQKKATKTFSKMLILPELL
ncbi:HAD family hydrolase [Winogradskyella vincentii]|uniref:HAD-IA family hydrolase n=1 Tax=Winogradskyella vincentii TaxID=2877122 RepID=A0ABS7Y1Z6_9FLAO|nr:HAD-IA family hydrolase [Winogradskyella vincentii]MCA0153968.1 HAD-IA family hydrolase [Winogradskyella vincentii]